MKKDVYDVIHNKIVDYAEVTVLLFEHCNMKCAFCAQDHSNKTGASREEVLAKVGPILEWIHQNERPTKVYKVNILGGEVFSDEMIDSGMVDVYQEFINRIAAGMPDGNVIFNFVTNLVFDNTDVVLDFLKRNNLKCSVSYDPHGRFTAKQLAIFKRNVEIFKDHIAMIISVETKQNIKRLLEGDPYYDYLYDNFNVSWDSLIPFVNKDALNTRMMPSESEQLALYKLFIDKYPKSTNADPFVNDHEEYKMSCTRGNAISVLYDGTITGCHGALMLECGDPAARGLGVEIQSSNLVLNFFENYNCFSCEYFKKCPFTCFVKDHYSKVERDVGRCVYKETFDYAKNKFYKSSSH